MLFSSSAPHPAATVLPSAVRDTDAHAYAHAYAYAYAYVCAYRQPSSSRHTSFGPVALPHLHLTQPSLPFQPSASSTFCNTLAAPKPGEKRKR